MSAPLPAARAPGAPARLLVLDPASRRVAHRVPRDLATLVPAGSVVVVNDSATLPAALFCATSDGHAVELRLASLDASGRFEAVVFGPGDWRTPTEHRAVPELRGDERLAFAGGELHARLHAVDGRRVRGTLGAAHGDWLAALLRHGRPIQYSYLGRDVTAREVQTVFAARAWSFEMPCAGRALDWATLLELRRRGVVVAALTHAAGISSTGDPALDATLPLPERYSIPPATARAVARARAEGRPVLAVGTSVVRALEAAADATGHVAHGDGVARNVLGPETRLRAVTGLVTSLHEPGSSHFELLRALAPADLLLRARDAAAARGYLAHEFGDLALLLPGALPAWCSGPSHQRFRSHGLLALLGSRSASTADRTSSSSSSLQKLNPAT